VSNVASETTPGKALLAYYALLPGNTQSAWTHLTEKFRASRTPTYERYSNWWSGFSGVSVNVTGENGNTVTAVVTYVHKGGGSEHERDTFTLVQVSGVWMIDAQRTG
jgi:hypothetical protein